MKLIKKIKLYIKPTYNKIFLDFLYYLKKDLAGCNTVLDLGCGFNSPIQYCNIPFKTGVDLFDPYLEESKTKGIHNRYIKEDITKVEFEPKSFDAVVALDILEHLSKEDGRELLKKMEKWAKKKVIVLTPNGYVQQGEYDKNVLQNHKSGWKAKELEEAGFKVFGMDGLKNLRGYMSFVKYKPAVLWEIISDLTQEITYYFPKMAFHLYAVKEIN